MGFGRLPQDYYVGSYVNNLFNSFGYNSSTHFSVPWNTEHTASKIPKILHTEKQGNAENQHFQHAENSWILVGCAECLFS